MIKTRKHTKQADMLAKKKEEVMTQQKNEKEELKELRDQITDNLFEALSYTEETTGTRIKKEPGVQTKEMIVQSEMLLG